MKALKTASPSQSISVLFWNIGHTEIVPDSLHSPIRKRQSDIIDLSESEELNACIIKNLLATYGAFDLLRIPGGTIAMIKGECRILKSRRLQHESQVHFMEALITSMLSHVCDVGHGRHFRAVGLWISADQGSMQRSSLAGGNDLGAAVQFSQRPSGRCAGPVRVACALQSMPEALRPACTGRRPVRR